MADAIHTLLESTTAPELVGCLNAGHALQHCSFPVSEQALLGNTFENNLGPVETKPVLC